MRISETSHRMRSRHVLRPPNYLIAILALELTRGDARDIMILPQLVRISTGGCHVSVVSRIVVMRNRALRAILNCCLAPKALTRAPHRHINTYASVGDLVGLDGAGALRLRHGAQIPGDLLGLDTVLVQPLDVLHRLFTE